MFSDYEIYNNTVLLTFQETEKYVNCLNTIISKCNELTEKYCGEFLPYFVKKYPKSLKNILDLHNISSNHIDHKINFKSFESMFQHLQDINIDWNNIPHSETSDNIDKIVEFIDSVSKMEDKYHDIKKIFEIVNKMNI